MAYVVVLVLLAGVVWVVTAPLRRTSSTAAGPAAADAELRELAAMRRIDLEAARDAKYREIRDAELDHQTGKLSDADHEAIDSTLRAEAVALLRELDAVDEREQQLDADEPAVE